MRTASGNRRIAFANVRCNAQTYTRLHFQLIDRPSLLDSNGLPFTIDRFRLDGVVPSLETFVEADRVGTPVQFDSAGAGKRREQGFNDIDVVTFR